MEQKNELLKKIEKLEKRYVDLIESSRDCIFRVDRNKRFTLVNSRLIAMVGKEAEDLIGLKFSELFKPIQELDLKSDGDNSGFTFESVLECKDGLSRIMEVNLRLLREDRKIIGYTGIARDITERKELERELTANEEYFRGVFNNLSDGLLIIDDEFKVRDANDSFQEMFETELDSIIDKKYHNLLTQLGFSPKDSFFSLVEDTLLSEKPFSSLTLDSLLDKSGNEKNFEIAISNLVMNSHQKSKAIISFRDITTEVNLQEKLQESERGFLDLAENLDQIVYIFDFKTQKYKYISPLATKILGYHLDEFYESSWREIVYKNIHPEDTHRYRELLSKIEKGLFDTPFLQVRFKMKRGDGEYIWLQDSMHPIYDIDGNLLRIEGIIKDITEDKKYRIQLKEEITHLEAELENIRLSRENNIPELIVHSIQDGIFFANPAKKYMFVNQAFCDLTRTRKETLLNKNILDVPIGENWDEIKKNIKEKCIGEEKNVSFEQKIYFKDGDFTVLEFSCHKLKEKNSLINIGNVGIIRDVTEKKRSQSRYKISQKIIEALVTEPVDKSFEKMKDYLKKGIQFDIFNIMLRKNQKENKILIIDDFSTPLPDQIQHGFQYEIDGTASQKVIESGKPIIVNDVAESGFATSTILLSHGVHSFLSYPLKRNGNVIATLNFHSYNKNNFSESDYKILKNISNVLTFILNNALERAEIKK